MEWDYFEPRKSDYCDTATKRYVDARLDTLNKQLTAKIKETGDGAQSDWNQTNPEKKSYIKNKPSIPAAQIQADWTQTDVSALDYVRHKPSFAVVATTGSYLDLHDLPVIPAVITNVSELVNDADYQSGNQVAASIANALDDYTPASALGPVATSNDYNDLDNLPVVPVITIQSTDPGPGGSLAANHYIMVYEA